MKPKSLAEERLLMPLGVLTALALTFLRQDAGYSDYVQLLAKALLGAGSLSGDAIVQTTMESPYYLGPKLLAYGVAWASRTFSWTPQSQIYAVNLLLWTALACLMHRLALTVTASRAAAVLAVLFYGAGLPLADADAPYSMDKLERSLGMVPMLWALRSLVLGQRWRALAGLGAATYMHAVPAIYAWPLLLVEDFLEARRSPAARPGFLARLGAIALIALPILSRVGSHFSSPGDADYLRLGIPVNFVAGIGEPLYNRLTSLEGMVLALLALWRGRALAAAPLFGRALALSVLMCLAGTAAYQVYSPQSPMIVKFLVVTDLWLSRYLFDLTGLLFLSAWLADAMRRAEPLWPPFLLTLLTLTTNCNIALKLLAIGLGACLIRGKKRFGTTLTLLASAAPFAYKAGQGFFPAFDCFLREEPSGLFALVFLNPATSRPFLVSAAMGAALAAALLAGFWLSRRSTAGRLSSRLSLGLAVAIILLGGVSQAFRTRRSAPRTTGKAALDQAGMADWVRLNTPAEAVIIPSPLDVLLDSGNKACAVFMERGERSFFACEHYVTHAVQYGGSSALMASRLRALGLDVEGLSRGLNFRREARRADEAMTPGKVEKLLSGRGTPAYLLTRAGRRWPGEPVHISGSLALYELESR